VRGDGLIRVHQGNHGAEHAMPVGTEPSEILIYHYPIRSRAQFAQKIGQGGAAYAKNRELPVTIGWHWRRWHRMISSGTFDHALAEVMPTAAAIAAGLEDGSVIEDTTMVEALRALMGPSRRAADMARPSPE
jgi:hypothetical protein